MSAISKPKILKKAKKGFHSLAIVAKGDKEAASSGLASKKGFVGQSAQITFSGTNTENIFSSLAGTFVEGLTLGSGPSSVVSWKDNSKKADPKVKETIEIAQRIQQLGIVIETEKPSKFSDAEIYDLMMRFTFASELYVKGPDNKYARDKLSIQEFCREVPGAPHVTNMAKFIRNDESGLGYRTNHARCLSDKAFARVLFMSGHKKDGTIPHVSQVGRLAISGTDEEINYYFDNPLLKSDQNIRPYDPKRDQTNVVDCPRAIYNAVQKILKEMEKGGFKLSVPQKVELRQTYLKCGCGWLDSGLVWSMDEYCEKCFKIAFPGLKIDAGTRVILVCVESQYRLILGAYIIPGQPHVSDYCRALWYAMNNVQKLTNLPPMRPAIIITDNCSAAVKGEEFSKLCMRMGISHRNAHPGTPHAKLAVESCNCVVQCIITPFIEDLDFDHATGKIICPVETLLVALLRAVRSFNNRYRREGEHTRNYYAERHFDWFILPMDKDELPPPKTIFLDSAVVDDQVATTPDGCKYQVHRKIDNCEYDVQRDVADNSIQILVPGCEPFATKLISEGVFLV